MKHYLAALLMFMGFAAQTALGQQAKVPLMSATVTGPIMDYAAIPKIIRIGESTQGWIKIGHAINNGKGAAIDAYVQPNSIRKSKNGGQANIAIVTQHNAPDPLALPGATAITYLSYSYDCARQQSFYTAWDERTVTNTVINSGRDNGDAEKVRESLGEPVFLNICQSQPLPTPSSAYNDLIIFNNIKEFRDGNRLQSKRFPDGSEWAPLPNWAKDEDGNDFLPFVRIDNLSPPRNGETIISILAMYSGPVRIGKIHDAARVAYSARVRCSDMTAIYSDFHVLGINAVTLHQGPPQNNQRRELGPGKWYPVNKIADLVCQ